MPGPLDHDMMPVQLECVTLDDANGGKLLSQQWNEVAIDFDRGDVRTARDQLRGERPLPRPDLEDAIARLGIERIDDPREDPGIGEEVLAETFARSVRHAQW
jgi:hypothetical protein